MNLDEGKRTSTVTVTRTGSFSDPRYGHFDITQKMLQAMVANFNGGAYGQDIFIDVAHKPENGAAGKVVNLSVEGNRLRARVEWTELGIKAVKEKGYQYLSAEYHEDFQDNEQGHKHGPVLLGAALTVRPVIKRLDPVQLSEDGQPATLIHPELLKKLNQEISEMKDKYLKLLAVALGAITGLTEAMQKQLSESFGTALDGVTEDAVAKMLPVSYTHLTLPTKLEV
ncbi:MAG: phage protease [Proteobacteria bacterium]|nr:phage protease [Pseudomonadota bacterium]